MKKYVVPVSLGVVLIVAVVVGAMVFNQKPDPKTMASEALQELNAAQSFCFSFVQHEIVGAQEKLLADLSGERSGKDFSLKGKVSGNDVEMMCFGDDFFNRDMLNQRWIQYPGIANTVIQQLFPVEFNPSTLIEFDETGEVVVLDEESVSEKKCWVCSVTPRVTADSLNKEWKDFAATLYIDKSSNNVARIVLTADHTRKERKLRLTLDFDSIGDNISITKP